MNIATLPRPTVPSNDSSKKVYNAKTHCTRRWVTARLPSLKIRFPSR